MNHPFPKRRTSGFWSRGTPGFGPQCRADFANQIARRAIADDGCGKRIGIVRRRNPHRHEMMLQHRDPATSDFAVEWLLGELVEFSLFEFLVGTVPGGASETVTLGIVEARAADDRWNALQLTIDVTLPGGVTPVFDLVALAQHITAARQRVGLAHADAVTVIPVQLQRYLEIGRAHV